MNTLMTAWHLLRFDGGRHRLLLASLAGGVLLLMVSNSTALAGMPHQWTLLPIGVFLTQLMAVVLSVQGDAAGDPTAFWRGKPIMPRDLIVAKGLMALALLLFVVLGTLAAALLRGASISDVASWMLFLVLGALPWLLFAAAFGTGTGDRRELVPLLFAAWAGVFLLQWLHLELAATPITWWASYAVASFGALALVVRQYARPLPRMLSNGVIVALGTLNLHAMRWPMPLGVDGRAGASTERSVATITDATPDPMTESLVIDSVVFNPDGIGIHHVRLHVESPRAGMLYVVDSARAVARFADGTQVIGRFIGTTFTPRHADLTLPSGASWRDSGATRVEGDVPIFIWEESSRDGAATRRSWIGSENPLVEFSMTVPLLRLAPVHDTTVAWAPVEISHEGSASISLVRDSVLSRRAMRLRAERILPSARVWSFDAERSALSSYVGTPTIVLIDGSGRASLVRSHGEATSSRPWMTPFLSEIAQETFYDPAPELFVAGTPMAQLIRWQVVGRRTVSVAK